MIRPGRPRPRFLTPGGWIALIAAAVAVLSYAALLHWD